MSTLRAGTVKWINPTNNKQNNCSNLMLRTIYHLVEQKSSIWWSKFKEFVAFSMHVMNVTRHATEHAGNLAFFIQNTYSKCHFLTILFVNIRFFDGWVTFKHERFTLFSITFRNRVDFHSVYGVSTCFLQYIWKILHSSVVLSVLNTCHVRWESSNKIKACKNLF